jgi:alkanesulfonate monooxygenase SsuD/methylene tetrahydromethanopterin reductase-like flavin-dependent oxidoreductase (luciferase family)
MQLPFHHPVRLAVQLALLDNLSKGRIDVGVGKGTIYNEYEFVGHGLRSDDSRGRMEEALDIIGRLWGGGPVTYSGEYFQVQVPELRPRPVQRAQLPLWRSVISPASFSECGRLAGTGPRSGRRVARRRRAAPVVPDRLWRHEPRTEPGLNAPLRRRGDAGIPNLEGARRCAQDGAILISSGAMTRPRGTYPTRGRTGYVVRRISAGEAGSGRSL